MKFEVPIVRAEVPQNWKEDGRAEFFRDRVTVGSSGLPFLISASLVVRLTKVMEMK